VQFVSAQGGNVAIPKIATSSTAEWLTAEGGALTPSDTVMTEKTATPHWVGSLKVVSHQMVKQIVDPDLLGLDMLREVASTIDAAVLAGSGASGEPQGILGATDVGTQAGSSLAWAGVSNMIKLSAEANGEPSAFIGPPAVRDLLGQREKAAGSGLIWSDGRIDGLPAIATTSAPAATLFCGDWSQVVVVVWDSLRVAVDDSTFFADGRYQFRVLIGVDVVIRSSAAFCTSSSIT
jgi:HK97 family phage major capsid protein